MNSFAFYFQRTYNWHPAAITVAWLVFGALLVLAFELWMLVDCITNKKVPTIHKVWWIVGMFLIHPFVAIAYLFASRLSYNK